jgi:hypothetical protein
VYSVGAWDTRTTVSIFERAEVVGVKDGRTLYRWVLVIRRKGQLEKQSIQCLKNRKEQNTMD